MKLISWNVNGIRAVLKKGFTNFINWAEPDILCLQETKISKDLVDDLISDYKYQFWSCAEKKGYSGTCILTNKEPLDVTYELSEEKHANEGRVVTAEFDQFYLVNVYTPNAKSDLARLDYRYNEWDPAFREHLLNLKNKKPVICCGDLNVAHKEIDLANPKSNRKSPGFTDEEREGFSVLLESGFIDSFREIHPNEPDHYSWWSYRGNARAKNVGWRIDYFILSNELQTNVKDAYILNDILGSDHAPVGLELKI